MLCLNSFSGKDLEPPSPSPLPSDDVPPSDSPPAPKPGQLVVAVNLSIPDVRIVQCTLNSYFACGWPPTFFCPLSFLDWVLYK